MRSRPSAVLPVAALLLLGACGIDRTGTITSDSSLPRTTVATTGTDTPSTGAIPALGPSTTLPERDVPVLQWSPCGEGLECTTLVAPLDYFATGTESVRLPVVRHLALKPNERIGSLLVNPGGPGFGGTYLARNAATIFTEEILDRFDVVGWDPRGTGESVPAIDCIDNYDPYFAIDPTPDSTEERQAIIDSAKSFADACAERTGSLLSHVSTQDSARDIDLLRRALGEPEVSYFGFSYGSELGASWVTMFPDTVRAAVFDGAADPNASAAEATIDQARGFEIAFNAFLADCATKCSFPRGEDPGTAFDDLVAAIDANDYPTVDSRPRLNLGITYTAVANAMYATSLWPALDAALNEARDGNGAALLRLNDDYYQRRDNGTYGNEIEAFLAITCADDRGPATVEEIDAYSARLREAAPRLGASFEGGYACVFWPVESEPNLVITGRGAGPIVVIGTTNDPATPLESSQKMTRSLEGGVLVKVTGNGHTGYTRSACAQKIVNRYLIDGEPPSAEVECG